MPRDGFRSRRKKMNRKNISKSLTKKIDNWLETIDDEKVVDAIKKNAIVTGGALVSLLNGEEPNDLDIYFKTLDACEVVAKYYAKKWNETHDIRKHVEIKIEDDRVQCFIASEGAVIEDGETAIDDFTEPYVSENEDNPTEPNPNIEKPKYRPRYFSTNAISLSDKIQIVIRFWGSVETIHENYDFVHCTCSYDYDSKKVELPVAALESIINKELVYQGSKYPLCSIIRTRKFISRGWHINAGQYVKMALQLNQLNLADLKTFKDQLCGVDSAYFDMLIKALADKKEKDPEFELNPPYVIELINRIF